MQPISASAQIPARPEVLFSFLADPRNHWLLARGKIELQQLETGEEGKMSGWVLIRGPLGVRRRARTRVLSAVAPSSLSGIAEVGRRTRAWVAWTLEESEQATTHVVLSAVVMKAGALDRLLLLLGARWWMGRLFAGVLDGLGEIGAPERPARDHAGAGAAVSSSRGNASAVITSEDIG